MKTFLIVVLGIFFGGILLLIVLWYGLKFAIRRFGKKLAAQLAEAFAGLAAGGVPPFRISLIEQRDEQWKNGDVVEQATRSLVEAGYQSVGDFRIPEIPTVQLQGIRAMVHPDACSYAVIYDYPEKGVFLDLACYFTNDDHVTVSNSPETGLDKPEFSRMIRIEADLAKDASAPTQLHERLCAEMSGREAKPASAAEFKKVFVSAYAREMNWRIERGGVTADEVRRATTIGGGDPPDDAAVKMVQLMWRSAISNFVDEQLRERFLNYITKMSAAEWEKVRDRLFFVHEHSDREQLIRQLSYQLPPEAVVDLQATDGEATAITTLEETDEQEIEDRQAAMAEVRVRGLFAERSVQEGFVRVQELLPPDRRYRRLVGIKTPYKADVYVEPVLVEED